MNDTFDLDSLLLANPDKCKGIPFAESLVDGSMLDSVEARSLSLRGLLKNYCCPDCKENVVFRWCKDKVDHFSHQAGSECKSSGMTSLHLMAQQILVQAKQCYLPRSAVKRGLSDWIMVCKEVRGYQADNATMEVRCDSEGVNRIADVVFHKGKYQIVIEVAVAHFCEQEKIQNYRDGKIPSLEIDLSKLKRDISKEELSALLTGVGGRSSQLSRLFRWIYHPRYDQSEAIAIEQDTERREEEEEKQRKLERAKEERELKQAERRLDREREIEKAEEARQKKEAALNVLNHDTLKEMRKEAAKKQLLQEKEEAELQAEFDKQQQLIFEEHKRKTEAKLAKAEAEQAERDRFKELSTKQNDFWQRLLAEHSRRRKLGLPYDDVAARQTVLSSL